MLANSVCGVKPLIMRKAVHACITPILTYGAPAWWPGVTRTNQKGKTVQNRIQELCKKLDKAQNVALKAILPAWKTTPTKILQREAATPPIRHTINHLCVLASLLLHKLEPKHPLRMRTKRAFALLNPTRLERLARRCPDNVEFSDPLLQPDPWEEHILGGANKALTASGATGDKDKAAKKFNAQLQNLDSLDIVVYTDGSQETDRSGTPTGVGAAWVIKSRNQWLGKRGIPLGSNAEVFDSEAIALCKGLETTLATPET